MSLINSNRKEDVKPLKSASLSDLERSSVSEKNETKKANSKTKQGRKTTLSIDSHTKNMLQVMVWLGDAPNQKEGFSVAINAYYDNLTQDKKNMFDMMLKQLNSHD